ncbi:hypothetical protein CCR94_00180 [Rhodoblastus sphagnicola]|uniref:Uncharacterized protein n=1 Tax=Rhodoblastus sphagnicola TaxID=333368 RepID=A0A2S6NHG3_9HYPH|nr:hypothetical protein CCR94_00180 [Rhodoblastus sphagnicola]
MLADCAAGLRAFARESDIEPWNSSQAEHPLPNYASAADVWMDTFSGRAWIDSAAIERHFSRGKDIRLGFSGTSSLGPARCGRGHA